MPDKLSRKLLKPCLFLVLPLGTLVLGSGCSKKSEPTPAASETASAAPPPSPSTPPSNVAPALPPQILGARLASEAASRTPNEITVEKVFEAFTKTGATLHDPKQHLATPFSARYCMEAHTANDVVTDVCEFADDASATKGKEASTKAFGSVPLRTLYLNKKTMLTLRDATPTPKSAEEIKTLVATFTAL